MTGQAIGNGGGASGAEAGQRKTLILTGDMRVVRLSTLPLPVALVATGISCGMAFRAFDGLAGQALSALVNALLLYAAFLRQPPAAAFWRRAVPVLGLVLAAVVWGLMATLRVSGGVLPDYVLGKLLSLASGICALLLGAMMARGRRRRRALLDWLLLINAILLFVGLVMRELGGDATIPYWTLERLGRFTGLAGNANVTAAISACCAVIAFVRLTGRQRPPAWAGQEVKGFFAHLPLLTITTGVVIIAGSRFTAGLLGCVLVFYLILWRRTRRVSLPRLAVMGSALTLVMIVSYFFSGLLAERYNRLGASWDDRVATWTHLWDVFVREPWLGYGLGSFPTINAHFLSTPQYAQANWAVNSAHDVGLQMLLQGGIPYCALILAAWAFGIAQTMRVLRGRWIRDQLLIAVLIVLLTGCASVDLVLDMPAPLSLYLFLTGLLWGQALDRRKVVVEFSGR